MKPDELFVLFLVAICVAVVPLTAPRLPSPHHARGAATGGPAHGGAPCAVGCLDVTHLCVHNRHEWVPHAVLLIIEPTLPTDPESPTSS